MPCSHGNSLTFTEGSDEITARFEGLLSGVAIPTFSGLLDRLQEVPSKRVVLDLSGLTRLDRGGLPALNALAVGAGGGLRIVSQDRDVVVLLTAAGLGDLISSVP